MAIRVKLSQTSVCICPLEPQNLVSVNHSVSALSVADNRYVDKPQEVLSRSNLRRKFDRPCAILRGQTLRSPGNRLRGVVASLVDFYPDVPGTAGERRAFSVAAREVSHDCCLSALILAEKMLPMCSHTRSRVVALPVSPEEFHDAARCHRSGIVCWYIVHSVSSNVAGDCICLQRR